MVHHRSFLQLHTAVAAAGVVSDRQSSDGKMPQHFSLDRM